MDSAEPKLVDVAVKVSRALEPLSSYKIAQEVLILDQQSAAVVCEIDGRDYIMTIQQVPKQRSRPSTQ